MSEKASHHPSRNLSLIYGESLLTRIAQANLLIVGVGGIGCELLKLLSKSGFRKFTILDLDTIEETNLNRQFFFRKGDIGGYKAQIGKERILMIDPELQVEARTSSIYETQYDVDFFSKFDVIVSALDNVKARSHLGKMAVKAGKPMVDGGTQGFNGQTMVFYRGFTECYNCRPMAKANDQSFAACTIRDTPERPVHCIVYAKNFYDCFFGGDKENSFKGDIKLQEFVKGDISDEEILKACKDVFDALFYHRISSKLELHALQNKTTTIHTLKYEDAINMTQVLTNPPSTFEPAEDRKQKASPYDEQKLWSIKLYAQRFVQSMFNILKHSKDKLGTLSFEKDDENCMMLVYCVTTLRTYNFMIRQAPGNKHKYLTYFDCKDKAGRIIPAIASTNAIAAATQMQQIIKMISGQLNELKCVVFSNNPINKLNGSEMNTANLNCEYCSNRSHNLRVECDFQKTTWGDVEQYLKKFLSYGRDLFCKSNQGSFHPLLDSMKDTQDTRKQLLSEFQHFISETNTMQMMFIADEHTELALSAFFRHKSGSQGCNLLAGSAPSEIRRQLLEYQRQRYEKRAEQRKRECRDAGWK